MHATSLVNVCVEIAHAETSATGAQKLVGMNASSRSILMITIWDESLLRNDKVLAAFTSTVDAV